MTAEDYFQIGLHLAQANQLGDAFAALEECVALDPNHASACKELARLSLMANEVRAFTNWLHEAQRIDERDPEPHIMMAEYLMTKRRWEEAGFEAGIALRKTPTSGTADRLAAIQARLAEEI